MRLAPNFRMAAGLAIAAALVAVTSAGCADKAKSARPRPPIVATPAKGDPPAPTPSTGAIQTAFDNVYSRFRHDILGACFGAIVERTVATRCFGRISRQSTQRSTPTTLFQVGSIAKTMTATLLALRADQGKVRLGDPLRKYIPAGDAAAQIPSSLTLLLAATHHSGLPRSTPVDAVSSLDQYFGLAGRCEAASGCAIGAPGERYLYSNFAYGVLGQALALHDGFRPSSYSGWEKDVTENITGPLGLRDTRSWFGWKAADAGAFDRRRAHATMGDPPHEAEPPYYPPAPYGDPAAGLYSTASDMLRWLSFSMGLAGTPQLESARRQLYDNPRLVATREAGDPRKAVGLAWDIDTYRDGATTTTCISKDGSARGFHSNMVFIPSEHRGAFVMLNSNPESVTTPQIASELINSLPPAPKPVRAPGRCGVYEP